MSEEKREGTLGLLFLTLLSGFDVVIGKIAARSLSAAYNLLAVIPVLALPLLIGGVTGDQVMSISVVLVVSTIFSLCVGAAVSSRGVRERAVMMQTLFVLIVLTIGPRLLSALGIFSLFPALDLGRSLSPLNVFIEAQVGFRPSVQGGAMTLLFLSAAFVIYAAWRIRRFTLDSEVECPKPVRHDSARQGGTWARALLWQQPFLWLALRSRTLGRNVAIFCSAAVTFGVLSRLVIEAKWSLTGPFVILGSYGFHTLYKFLLAGESCRQLNDDRRSGALELLLVTPLPVPLLVRGQIKAAARTWLPAAVSLAVMNFCWMTEKSFLRDLGVLLPCSVALIFADGFALTWRGVLNSLRGERYSRTVFRTFFQVHVPPLALIVLLLAGAIGIRRESVQTIFVLWSIGAVFYDIVLAARARIRLLKFRLLASGDAIPLGVNPYPNVIRWIPQSAA